MKSHIIPEDLKFAQESIYRSCGITYDHFVRSAESSEYGACTFKINHTQIIFRVAKITPTKIGQFVTTWKRNDQGLTAPFEIIDDFDMMIISVRAGERFGQFIFPKAILLAKGIISDRHKEGKRGIRVYPPWDEAQSKQAQKTQEWQLKYFLRIDFSGNIDCYVAKQLLSLNS